ncbi:MAG: hypothetical protein ACWA40_06785 [Planktomarina sp.]
MTSKSSDRQKVDISSEESELDAKNAHLEVLDKEKGIKARYLRERLVVTLSCIILGLVTLFAFYAIICKSDDELKKWGLQTLTALIGFAVGILSVSKDRRD